MSDDNDDGCGECGAPSGTHNATYSVSIRERNAEIRRLNAKVKELRRSSDEAQ